MVIVIDPVRPGRAGWRVLDHCQERAKAMYGAAGSEPIRRWRDLWSAGHSVSGATATLPVACLVETIEQEYRAAADRLKRIMP